MVTYTSNKIFTWQKLSKAINQILDESSWSRIFETLFFHFFMICFRHRAGIERLSHSSPETAFLQLLHSTLRIPLLLVMPVTFCFIIPAIVLRKAKLRSLVSKVLLFTVLCPKQIYLNSRSLSFSIDGIIGLLTSYSTANSVVNAREKQPNLLVAILYLFYYAFSYLFCKFLMVILFTITAR